MVPCSLYRGSCLGPTGNDRHGSHTEEQTSEGTLFLCMSPPIATVLQDWLAESLYGATRERSGGS